MLIERISSNTGATLVLALVFFLLCAVAGSVILVAGSGAAGRLSDVKTDNQAYYSATSASTVLKAELEKGIYDMDSGNRTDGSNASSLDDLIKAGLTATASSDSDEDYKVTGSIEYSANNKLNVVFDFIMNKNQNVTIKVKKLDSNSNADSNIEYQCMITTVAHTSQAGTQNLINWTARIVPYIDNE